MALSIAAIIVFVGMFVGEIVDAVADIRRNSKHNKAMLAAAVNDRKYLLDMEEAYAEDVMRAEVAARNARIQAIIDRTRNI